jgi:hypothetical protein
MSGSLPPADEPSGPTTGLSGFHPISFRWDSACRPADQVKLVPLQCQHFTFTASRLIRKQNNWFLMFRKPLVQLPEVAVFHETNSHVVRFQLGILGNVISASVNARRNNATQRLTAAFARSSSSFIAMKLLMDLLNFIGLASAVTSNPANGGHPKTGQRKRHSGQELL